MALRGAVADDGGGQRGAAAAIALIDMLDDFLAPLMLEIHIDVGRLAAFGAEETLEQDIEFVGIDGGDAQEHNRPRNWRPNRVPGRECPWPSANFTMSCTVRK